MKWKWKCLRYKKLVDFLFNVHWIGGWCKAIDWLTIFINQEFGEVPFDRIAKETRLLILEEFVQWTGRITIHIDLGLGEKKENLIEFN